MVTRIKDNKNKAERMKMVCAMEYIIRNLNDEELIDPWLMCGVADEDIPYGDMLAGEAESYIDNETFASLMGLFLRIMGRARVSGLYCDGVLGE